MQKTKDVFTLKALEKFRCIGSDCSRNCCREGWLLPIDAEILNKWNSETSTEDEDWFLSSISEERLGNDPVIKAKQDNTCYFLNSADLCEIQTRYDHSFLPRVCREYPRVKIDSPYRDYQTAAFSCPEIVRLVLFDNIEEEPFKKSAKDRAGALLDSNAMFNYALDRFVAEVLGLSKFPLGVRLFYIANVFGELFQRAQQSQIDSLHIEQLIKQSKQNLFDINLAVKQDKLKPEPVTAGSYWKVIYSLCKSREINPVFMEDDSGALSKLINESGDSHDDYARIYQAVKQYSDFARADIRGEYGKLLQVFVKVYFSSKGFPVSSRGTATNALVVECMAGLSMLQLLLWMQIQKKTALSAEFLQELIVDVCRKYAHSNAVVKHLEEDSHMLRIERYSSCFLDLF
ncbi:flagellin lysine-N-methylase [Kaarinaea lacus]